MKIYGRNHNWVGPATTGIGARRRLGAAFVAAVGTAFVIGATWPTATAHAGPIERLSRTIKKSKSEKARISAAVSLARLKDRRAVPVLIVALRDKSESVRAIAATALGHLGDRRALSALRKATKDKADMVRRRAAAAIDRIEKRPKATARVTKKKPRERRLARIRMDAQEAPLRRPRAPELHVTVKSTADKSRGKTRKRTRQARARRMKSLMMKEMSDSDTVTIQDSVAKKLGLQTYALDASIMKLDRRVRGKFVEVECEIRVTISNGRGRMISFLTGGAKVQVPKTTYRRQYLAQMRREALENAVQNVYRDVLSFLHRNKS